MVSGVKKVQGGGFQLLFRGRAVCIASSTKTVNNGLYYMIRDPYVGPRGV